VIPGNDDALRAIRLFASKVADSIAEGVRLPPTSRPLTLPSLPLPVKPKRRCRSCCCQDFSHLSDLAEEESYMEEVLVESPQSS